MTLAALCRQLPHPAEQCVAEVWQRKALQAKTATLVTPATPPKQQDEILEGEKWLVGLRRHLEALAIAEGLPKSTAQELADDDIAACQGLPDDILQANLRVLDRGRRMDRGEVPAGYTKACHCDGCGPVWLWPTCPYRVKACPWCFRRNAGRTFPRPVPNVVRDSFPPNDETGP